MFRIDTEMISASCEGLQRTEAHITECESDLIDSIRAVSNMKGMEEAVKLLEGCRNEVDEEKNGVLNTLSLLERVNETYLRCENQIILNADGYNAKLNYHKIGILNIPTISEENSLIIDRLIM